MVSLHICVELSFKPEHDKTNKTTVAYTQSDQSSLCALCIAKDPNLLQADSKDSDQTRQMPRMIQVFARRTHHFVDFVVLQLI